MIVFLKELKNQSFFDLTLENLKKHLQSLLLVNLA